MRSKKWFSALILSLMLIIGLPPVGCSLKPATSVTVGGKGRSSEFEMTFGFFHNSLSPYGHWVNIGSYGPCWRPANLVVGWQPYFNNGHWAYTEYGWTWVSFEPWGPIAFHYGTWFYDPFYGWVWVPGYVWGPAWVTWMYTDYYIGWAPLPPRFRFHGRHGFAGQPVIVNNNYYIFVPHEHMHTPNLDKMRVPFERSREIVRKARPVTTISIENNHIINHGPDAPSIEKIRNRRDLVSIETISREARIKPMPVQGATRDTEIELVAPNVNRQEAKRVIKDFDGEERAARADRERERRKEPQQPADQSGVKPLPKINEDREPRRIEREQRRQQEEQLRRQQQEKRETERLRQQQEKQQRQLEQEQRRKQNEQLRQQERQQRQQQQELDRLHRQQEKEQRNTDRKARKL